MPLKLSNDSTQLIIHEIQHYIKYYYIKNCDESGHNITVLCNNITFIMLI